MGTCAAQHSLVDERDVPEPGAKAGDARLDLHDVQVAPEPGDNLVGLAHDSI
jgi:hypothetical protein